MTNKTPRIRAMALAFDDCPDDEMRQFVLSIIQPPSSIISSMPDAGSSEECGLFSLSFSLAWWTTRRRCGAAAAAELMAKVATEVILASSWLGMAVDSGFLIINVV